MAVFDTLRRQLEGAACEDCLFFDRYLPRTELDGSKTPRNHGECVRRAPAMGWDEKGDVRIGGWPIVYDRYWCGEFIRKKRGGR